MIVYIYDVETGEYLRKEEAFIDPMATERLGEDVFLIPGDGTELEPPEVNKAKKEIAIFRDGKWEITHDYRGSEIYDLKTGEVSICDYIGELKEAQFVKKTDRKDFSVAPYVEEALNKFIEINDVTFKPSSTEDLVKLVDEHTTATDKILSRDDLNKPFVKTVTDLRKIIKYLSAYKQLVYIKKWKKENELDQLPTDKMKEKCMKDFKIEITDEDVNTFLGYSKEDKAIYLEDIYKSINKGNK